MNFQRGRLYDLCRLLQTPSLLCTADGHDIDPDTFRARFPHLGDRYTHYVTEGSRKSHLLDLGDAVTNVKSAVDQVIDSVVADPVVADHVVAHIMGAVMGQVDCQRWVDTFVQDVLVTLAGEGLYASSST